MRALHLEEILLAVCLDAQGSGNFVTRLTAVCVTIFFCTSIGLAYIASNKNASFAVEQIQENSSQSVETKEQPFGSDKLEILKIFPINMTF